MTFVFRHPNYYKKLKEQQASENDQESENNEDKDSYEPVHDKDRQFPQSE